VEVHVILKLAKVENLTLWVLAGVFVFFLMLPAKAREYEPNILRRNLS